MPVVHVGGRPPAFDERRRVERVGPIQLAMGLDVVRLQIGVERFGMAVGEPSRSWLKNSALPRWAASLSWP